MAILLRQTQILKVNTEDQAVALIEQEKKGQTQGGYQIGKSGYQYKQKTAKGEIIAQWYLVTVQKDFEGEDD